MLNTVKENILTTHACPKGSQHMEDMKSSPGTITTNVAILSLTNSFTSSIATKRTNFFSREPALGPSVTTSYTITLRTIVS